MPTLSDKQPATGCCNSDREAENDDFEVPKGSAIETPTILDVLHVYCWAAIFSYLPIEDIVRSERVCRRWQILVHDYLQDREFCIQYPGLYRGSGGKKNTGTKCRSITLKERKVDSEWFAKMTKAMGPSIVRSDCLDARSLMSIARDCMYIEDITVTGWQDSFLYDSIGHIFSLKRVTFMSCFFAVDLSVYNLLDTDVADVCIGKILRNDNLEDVMIDSNKQVTGSCLRHLKQSTKLKSLCVRYCQRLDYNHVFFGSHYLTEITTFNLSGNPITVLENVHLILDRMPKLEDLSLERYKKTDLDNKVHESIGRLGRLKRLSVRHNENVTDEWLVAIARGCKQLEELHMQNCSAVTGWGLVKLCRGVGTTLTTLSVMDTRSLKNDHLATCMSLCPKLVSLDVRGCLSVQRELVAAARDARRLDPLRLRLWYTRLSRHEEKQRDGLILDFESDEDYYYD